MKQLSKSSQKRKNSQKRNVLTQKGRTTRICSMNYMMRRALSLSTFTNNKSNRLLLRKKWQTTSIQMSNLRFIEILLKINRNKTQTYRLQSSRLSITKSKSIKLQANLRSVMIISQMNLKKQQRTSKKKKKMQST